MTRLAASRNQYAITRAGCLLMISQRSRLSRTHDKGSQEAHPRERERERTGASTFNQLLIAITRKPLITLSTG